MTLALYLSQLRALMENAHQQTGGLAEQLHEIDDALSDEQVAAVDETAEASHAP